ncbi:hypothetical protein C1H76_6108 [Elsinoe australis]|uniref:Uncharacterized protein n=1 Tax=Elsinoe australis TaxID=40998 RepID=A0A4V6DTR1_9PEZI|nr:hypothetical protein C1H76_6108 [Elsinoe australis]
MGLLDTLRSKYELYRLEQRYTRRETRTTFKSGAVYVDGEYIYQNGAPVSPGEGPGDGPGPWTPKSGNASGVASPTTSSGPSSPMSGSEHSGRGPWGRMPER